LLPSASKGDGGVAGLDRLLPAKARGRALVSIFVFDTAAEESWPFEVEVNCKHLPAACLVVVGAVGEVALLDCRMFVARDCRRLVSTNAGGAPATSDLLVRYGSPLAELTLCTTDFVVFWLALAGICN